VASVTSVARELAPAGMRIAPPPSRQLHRILRIYDCFAAEREQAPSPQGARRSVVREICAQRNS
jgi:hypothetical protein